MIQAARIIGTGIATTGLVGVVVRADFFVFVLLALHLLSLFILVWIHKAEIGVNEAERVVNQNDPLGVTPVKTKEKLRLEVLTHKSKTNTKYIVGSPMHLGLGLLMTPLTTRCNISVMGLRQPALMIKVPDHNSTSAIVEHKVLTYNWVLLTSTFEVRTGGFPIATSFGMDGYTTITLLDTGRTPVTF